MNHCAIHSQSYPQDGYCVYCGPVQTGTCSRQASCVYMANGISNNMGSAFHVKPEEHKHKPDKLRPPFQAFCSCGVMGYYDYDWVGGGPIEIRWEEAECQKTPK